jgi:hypothetical protein
MKTINFKILGKTGSVDIASGLTDRNARTLVCKAAGKLLGFKDADVEIGCKDIFIEVDGFRTWVPVSYSMKNYSAR